MEPFSRNDAAGKRPRYSPEGMRLFKQCNRRKHPLREVAVSREYISFKPRLGIGK